MNQNNANATISRRRAVVGLCAGLLLGSGLAGCGGDSEATIDAPTSGDALIGDGPVACPRPAAAADRVRALVVSKPYDANSQPAAGYDVLAVATDGKITNTGTSFAMATAVSGEITFTPDGKVGLLAQKDGSVGVFTLDGLTPTVVHAKFTGDFYADSVTVDPTGQFAYIVDGNFRNNGGGLYRSRIGCDGTLSTPERVVESKLAKWMFYDSPTTALVVARDVGNSAAGADAHRIDVAAPAAVLAGVDAFGHNEASVGGGYWSAERNTLWIGDTSQFGGIANKVAIVSTVGGLSNVGSVVINDVAAIRVSPFADLGVVASGFGDAIFVVDRGGTAGAYQVAGKVAYMGAAPQLPSGMAMIERGALKGHVFVAEVSGVRHLVFGSAGGVTDVGSFGFPSGVENIVGAIGIAP